MSQTAISTFSVLDPDDVHGMPILEVTGKADDFIQTIFNRLMPGKYLIEIVTPIQDTWGDVYEMWTRVYGCTVTAFSVSIYTKSGNLLVTYEFTANGSYRKIPA